MSSEFKYDVCNFMESGAMSGGCKGSLGATLKDRPVRGPGHGGAQGRLVGDRGRWVVSVDERAQWAVFVGESAGYTHNILA